MTRKFCDRCGIECKTLTQIKIPKEKHKHGYSAKNIEVCPKCNALHESFLEKLTDIHFVLYADFLSNGGEKNEG